MNGPTLHDMMNSQAWQAFISSRLGNDLFINDPDRADRCARAAESGADGSTHAEHIEDMRDFLDDYVGGIRRAIAAEIDEVEAWHLGNGSLHEEIG